jgi:hypothetical protein
MQMGFRFAAVFFCAVIAGCAGGKSVPRDSAVVTVSAYGPDLFGQHTHGVGGTCMSKSRRKGQPTSAFHP